jgi:REP element-mobilizing transposase RayT
MTYLITFSCYGHHLHGDEEGSVDRRRNTFGNERVLPNRAYSNASKNAMDQPLYVLDLARRSVVLAALHEVCYYRLWTMLAAHVRSSHVHVVVEADAPAERVLTDFKAYASRALNKAGLDTPDRKRWARHGSTKYIWDNQDVSAAIRYVVDEQGK